MPNSPCQRAPTRLFNEAYHLSEWATHFGLYSQGQHTQALVLIYLLLLVIASTYSLRFKMNTPPELKLMLFDLSSALFWLALSIVSNHTIDRVTYSPIGHVYLICWLWNISAFCIISAHSLPQRPPFNAQQVSSVSHD